MVLPRLDLPMDCRLKASANLNYSDLSPPEAAVVGTFQSVLLFQQKIETQRLGL
jgi:hypothetical protein